jgi:hypothetical protein
MLPNFLQLIIRRAPHDYEQGFVRAVRPSRKRRNRKIEVLIWVCWVLIALKSVFVVWAVRHYHIPFSPLWVILPTIAFAALCTWVYYRR